MSVPAAYVGVVLIWSTTPLAIQWSSEGVGFLFGITARMTISVVLCLALLKLLRVVFPWDDKARKTYMISGVGLYAAMLSVYWGAQHISSGLVSVVYGLTPLITTIMAALLFKEGSISPTKILGILLAIAGLVIIFDPRIEPDIATFYGIGGVLLSSALHALSMLGVKRVGGHVPVLAVTTGGLSVAVPLYLLTWFVVGAQWPEQISDKNMKAILYLSVLGSVIGFVMFYYILKKVSADVVALITLITPVCALALGHFLNGESLESTVLIGTGFILLGLAVHHWGSKFLGRRYGLEKA